MGATAPDDPLSLLQTPQPPGAAHTVSRARLALAWQAFESAQARAGGLALMHGATFKPPDSVPITEADPLPTSLAVQAHYLQQHCFVSDNVVNEWLALLGRALAQRPVSLVHGVADAVCHPDVTAAIAARWPHSTVRWVAEAGHDMDSPPMRQALTEAARNWVGRIAPLPA